MRQHKTTTKPEPKKLTTPHMKPGIVAVAGLIMHLRLVSGRGGSLLAEYYTKDIKKALEAIDKLKTAGFRPNIIKSSAGYVVYISTTDLQKLAEEDETIRKAIALYLTEKVKTWRQPPGLLRKRTTWQTERWHRLETNLFQRMPEFLPTATQEPWLPPAMAPPLEL